MATTSKRKASATTTSKPKEVPFNPARYIIRTVLWIIAIYIISRLMYRPLSLFFFTKDTLPFFQNYGRIRLLIILVFLLLRVPGLLRRLFGKLYIYDDKLVYFRPRLWKRKTTTLIADIDGVSWSQHWIFPILCNSYVVKVLTKKDKTIKFKDICFGEHVYDLICKKANL